MKKIFLTKRNNMNIILLIFIELVLLYNGFLYLLNYLFGIGGLGQDWFPNLFNRSMNVSIGVAIFALATMISLWFSHNRFKVPIWYLVAYAVCYFLYSKWQDLFHLMPAANIFMLVFCLLTIVYYSWTHRGNAKSD